MSIKNKKILILGGCGYVGSYLTNYLYKKGYDITVFDTQWFGKNISKNIKVKIIKGDVRDIEKISFKGFHSIIHLANIANDPSVALNPTLSWEVNVFSSYLIIKKAANEGVKNFIYGSSGSVYGIKKEKKVTENLDLKPISIYNKTKMIAERIFMSFDKDIKVFSIRPATVCGFSPRMRLDVTVNLLTFQALTNKKMTIFGGKQIRPNINIIDMARVYEHFINNKNIHPGFYNAGFENLSIIDIAKKIKSFVPSEIVIQKVFDERSYRQNSDKLLKTGFKQLYSVEDAIKSLIEKYKSGSLRDNKKFHTVAWLKKKKII
jgi:nucleoside-diphosphate-sugar epimerase